MKIQGHHNEAIVYTDALEPQARTQIQTLVNQAFAEGSRIRVMPDVHAGAGCTIGTTMTIHDKVVPNLVGVDIGCGIETTELRQRSIDCAELDRTIRALIPAGPVVRSQAHERGLNFPLAELRCREKLNFDEGRERAALGTLGGGNHFIEVDRAEDGRLFLLIHSGSRHLGLCVAKHYQAEASRVITGKVQALRQKKDKSPEERAELNVLRAIPKSLHYLEGSLLEDYLHDMHLMQTYAMENRHLMTDLLLDALGLEAVERFTTVHNYIDMESRILRKGAVSARAGEKLLVPLNMRDGALICRGKGNPEWNYSAPHGAGRAYSRAAAWRTFDLGDFERSMEGIYSTSVSRDTIDEAPMAYKPMEAITKYMGESVEILERIRPIYNFKAHE